MTFFNGKKTVTMSIFAAGLNIHTYRNYAHSTCGLNKMQKFQIRVKSKGLLNQYTEKCELNSRAG